MLKHEDGGWSPVTRFGESFLRIAMSWPRVLQNGLEGSWPSKRIRTSAGSFARNKYVWPRFWPEKHYVWEENMHDELVAQAGQWPEGLWPIASSNADYRDSIILSMLHRRLVQVLFFCFLFSFVLWLLQELCYFINSVELASKHLFYVEMIAIKPMSCENNIDICWLCFYLDKLQY